jgi:hypothetical protein
MDLDELIAPHLRHFTATLQIDLDDPTMGGAGATTRC